MKKLILGMAAVALLATASCSKKSDEAAADSRFAVPQATSDSISQLYGSMVGGYVLSDFMNFNDDEHKTEQTKQDIIKGIRLVLANGNSSDGVQIGIQVGLRMAQQIAGFEEQGVAVNREDVIKNFIRAFQADSLDMESLRENNNVFTGLMQQVAEIDQARKEAEIAESPEAKQNLLSGKAFIDKVKKEPGVKVSASGLAYKIEQQGDTTVKITPNTLVSVNYKGSLIDGKVFDQSAEGRPATFAPSGVIPGFGEGLMLLGKGGKATFYIPADLAYGLQAPQAIGPNQTLVFDVEIVDVNQR